MGAAQITPAEIVQIKPLVHFTSNATKRAYKFVPVLCLTEAKV